MAARSSTGAPDQGDRRGGGGSTLRLITYFLVLFVLLIAFIIVGTFAVSQPIPNTL